MKCRHICCFTMRSCRHASALRPVANARRFSNSLRLRHEDAAGASDLRMLGADVFAGDIRFGRLAPGFIKILVFLKERDEPEEADD